MGLPSAWMSSWLDGKSLENAATVVLDVARCWGGDYRERAVEALGGGKAHSAEALALFESASATFDELLEAVALSPVP